MLTITQSEQKPAGEHKTPAELEQLKENWKADPVWDIEDTPTFEAYRDELKAYRLQVEAEQRRKRLDRLVQVIQDVAALSEHPMVSSAADEQLMLHLGNVLYAERQLIIETLSTL